MLSGRPTQVKAPSFSGNPQPWSVSRSSGDQLSTSRPQQTPDSGPAPVSRRLHQLAAPAALTRQVTGHSPTQPQDCGQSPVFRRPAKHLQTTADFRLGRQVTLAQPKASSQGYRPKRADQLSNPGQGPRLQGQPQTLVSLQVFRSPAKVPPDHSRLQTRCQWRTVSGVPTGRPPRSSPRQHLFLVTFTVNF